jgi:hypothetical protein
MKLERRKFIYQGYYNSTQGYPVPCECVLEYVEPIEAEALEKRVEELELAVERATINMIAAQNRVAELEKALREIALMPCDCFRNSGCGSCSAREALKTLEAKG